MTNSTNSAGKCPVAHGGMTSSGITPAANTQLWLRITMPVGSQVFRSAEIKWR